jgi:hypothetical protein
VLRRLVFLRVPPRAFVERLAVLDRVEVFLRATAFLRVVVFFLAPARVFVDFRAVVFFFTVFFRAVVFFAVVLRAPARDFVDLRAVVFFLVAFFFFTVFRVEPLRAFVDLRAVVFLVVPRRDVVEVRVVLPDDRVAISFGSSVHSVVGTCSLTATLPWYPDQQSQPLVDSVQNKERVERDGSHQSR